MFLEKIKELFFVNNKINNSSLELINNYNFEIKNRNNIYDKVFNDLILYILLEIEFKVIQKYIFLKSKKKGDKCLNKYDSKNKHLKNNIYEKNQEFNKKYIYNHLQNNINQCSNENEKESINQTKILKYSNNYQTQHQILDNIFNSKIKIKNNNKMVYMNSFLFMRKITKNKKKLFLKKKRSSKFRGVSRNGNHWQALIMNNRTYSYIGTYNSEELAARIYDLISIKRKGINAKTNFIYSNRQIRNILLKEINFKHKDINEENIKYLINDN